MKEGPSRLGGVVEDFALAREGPTVIIDRLPSCVKGFFAPLRPEVSKPQFAHLWTLVLALVVNLRSAKLVHLSRVAPRSTHRTRHGAFLNHADADVPGMLQERSCAALAAMKPRAGETLYLILDDHRTAKRGKKMARVSKIWDHKQQKFVRGHIVLFAAVLFRGVVLPWRVRLWKPKGQPGPRYRKLTDLAAQMVREFAPPAGLKVRVLFDAFYLSPVVVRACESKGFSYFSVAARNRSFRARGTRARGTRGRGRKIGLLAPGLIRHRGRDVADEAQPRRGEAAHRQCRWAPLAHRPGAHGAEQAAGRALEDHRRHRDQRDRPA